MKTKQCYERTQTEVAAMLQGGMEQLTMRGIDARLAELGYERQPGSRCAGTATNLETGNTYNCVTWGVRESDTKQSAYHFESRRDTKFAQLQELRQHVFAVVRGSVVSL